MKRWQLIALLAAAAVVVVGKEYYRTASPEDLRWILAPTAHAVTALGFGHFAFDAQLGYVDPALSLRLVGITGSATLSGDAITIDRLAANVSTGGAISAAGSVSLKAPGYASKLRLALNHVRYVDQSLLVATASGDLSLTGPLT